MLSTESSVCRSPMSDGSPFRGEPLYDELFQSLTRVLHRRVANHALLVGERGVGKSTVIAELSRRIDTGVIEFLAGKRIVSADFRFVPFDERRVRLASLLRQVVDEIDAIVCLEGLAVLLRADPAGIHRSQFLEGLSRSRCRWIGLLTPHEYEDFVAEDADFAEHFDRIDVPEPDVATAHRLLCHYATGLERKYGVEINREAIRQAAVLSAHYMLNDQLPSKALKVLVRACEDADFARSVSGVHGGCVTVDDVVRVVARKCGIPEETLRGVAENVDYVKLLGDYILGQDHAVREVATELGLIKAGMTDSNKPASVLLLLGQTGTGKTETAKVLARLYSASKRLKIYTLGNCVEPHSVSTIIGVPPGYVGNDQGGRLIHDLNTDPYSVVLLDEADKAHPDVLQPFLNLFDEGWVYDQRGVKAYADRAIFILTSNVGQRMIAEMWEQGKSPEEIESRMQEALSQIRHSKSDRPVFTPEFLSRIKRIIVFRPLSREALLGIARKLVAELQETWQMRRGKLLEISDAVVQQIGEKAHELNDKSKGKEGGRIVRKLIAEWFEAPLQREISRRPDDYKACRTIVLAAPPAEANNVNGQAVHVAINFR